MASSTRPDGSAVDGQHGEQQDGATPDGLARTGPHAGQQDGHGLAGALGWFSIGLGVAQLLAPARVARLVGASGVGRSRTLMQVLGAREILTGVGLLAQNQRSPWLWGRVAGDVLDLALLGGVVAQGAGRGRVGAGAAAVAGVAALDVLAARRTASASSRIEGVAPGRGITVTESITVRRPRAEVYAFWRNFENLPRFMRHLESVTVTSDTQSHWVARAPARQTVEWTAEMTEDIAGEAIAWRSCPGASVPNAGRVRFAEAPGGRGTEVKVHLRYEPPAGALGAFIARLFGEEPRLQVADDLRRFKTVMETGELLVSDATAMPGLHPARPVSEEVEAPGPFIDPVPSAAMGLTDAPGGEWEAARQRELVGV